MREYNIKSIKDFKKTFNRTLPWTVISVTDQYGYSRKIAIKKGLLKKTFKVDISGIQNNEKMVLENVALNQELDPFSKGECKITIPNVGVFSCHHYHLQFSDPQQDILSTNTDINRTIRLAKEQQKDLAQQQATKVLEQQKDSYETQLAELQKKHKIEIFDREYDIKKRLSSIQDNLMEGTYSESGTECYFEKPNELQKARGWTTVPRTRDVHDEGKVTYNLDFLIEELVIYAQRRGYTGFDGNRFQEVQSKISSLTRQIKEEYSDKKVQDIYVLHGLLASELCTRFIGFCQYIEENNLKTNYTWSKTKNRREWDDEYTLTNTITDFFQKTIDGVAQYINRVCGAEYQNQFLEQVGSLKQAPVEEKIKEKKI